MTNQEETPKHAEVYGYNKAFLVWLCVVAAFWPGLPVFVFAVSSWARGVPFHFDLSRVNSKAPWLALALCYMFFLLVTAFYISQRKDIKLTDESISSSILGWFIVTISWQNADSITIRTFRSPSRGVNTSAVLVRARNGKLIILSDRIDYYPKLLAHLVKIASDNAIPIVREGADS